MNEVEVGAAVARVVLERLGGRPVLPSPSDVPAEAELLGAVFAEQHSAIEHAKSLSPLDFTDPFWQIVRVTMEGMGWERITIPYVAVLMEHAGEGFSDESAIRMKQAMDTSPLTPRQSAKRIREASRARRLSRFLRVLEEDICMGRLTTDAALERLRKATEKR